MYEHSSLNCVDRAQCSGSNILHIVAIHLTFKCCYIGHAWWGDLVWCCIQDKVCKLPDHVSDVVAASACSYFLDWNLFNDTFQVVKGGRSVTMIDMDEKESGHGSVNQKRLRRLHNVQIPQKSVTHFQCPFNAGNGVGLFPDATQWFVASNFSVGSCFTREFVKNLAKLLKSLRLLAVFWIPYVCWLFLKSLRSLAVLWSPYVYWLF